MKKITILLAAFFAIVLTASAQFRMVGTGSWTSLGGGSYSATVTFSADLTGNSYLPNQIATGFRLVTGTPTSDVLQQYDVTGVSSPTLTEVTVTVAQVSPTNSAPAAFSMVYDPTGWNGMIPQVPFGSSGTTAQLQAAVDSYNAKKSLGMLYKADGTGFVNGDTLPAGGIYDGSGVVPPGEVIAGRVGSDNALVFLPLVGEISNFIGIEDTTSGVANYFGTGYDDEGNYVFQSGFTSIDYARSNYIDIDDDGFEIQASNENGYSSYLSLRSGGTSYNNNNGKGFVYTADHSYTLKNNKESVPDVRTSFSIANEAGGGGLSWELQYSDKNDRNFSSVTYGNGVYVALCSYNDGIALPTAVLTSTDGLNWTPRATPQGNYKLNWSSVTFGNGLFVAVASAGTNENRVMTSPDGINWTLRTTPYTSRASWVSVTYGNGLYVAVASGGGGVGSVNLCMYSANGINWTMSQMPPATWQVVTYGNGLFVALTPNAISGNPLQSVATSPDAVNWTIRDAANSNSWRSVTYASGLFVAVAASGTGNRVMTSPDGITWTLRTSAADNSWRSITYGAGLFVAISTSGTNAIMTSPDGITWTSRVNPATSWAQICYGGSKFVGVSASGNYSFTTSTDGITWAAISRNTAVTWRSVAYGNGLFVAVAPNGSKYIMTSPDGVNWTERSGPAANAWNSVVYGNGLFVAVASSGTNNRVMTSPDGITWTIRTSAANNSWNAITFGNGLFVAVASTGTGNRVMTSPDGITWTIRTSAADNNWQGITFGNGLFVAVAGSGTGNRVMTSPDGITWTARTSAADNNWEGIAYGNGLFVATSANATVAGAQAMTSVDGITWAMQNTGVFTGIPEWRSVTYGNGLFVAVSNFNNEQNKVITSPDGIIWTKLTSSIKILNSSWRSVTYANGLFVAVGNALTPLIGAKVMTSGRLQSSQQQIQVVNEGVNTGIPGQALNLNFVGAGVDAVVSGNTATVTIPGGGTSSNKYRAILNVKHLGVLGDGVTDESALIQGISDTTQAMLYFPKGTYIAHLTTAQGSHFIGEQGTQIRWTDNSYPTIQTGGTTVLEGIYFYNSHASGVSINSSSFSLRASNCTFSAWKNNASVGINETGVFRDCNFIVNDAGGTSIGTACWSANAEFYNCNFTGKFGADVQDSKFYNCHFEGDWGVHMPFGDTDNAGAASGYNGDAVFENCTIKGNLAGTYAIGLGNAASPALYNCTVVGQSFGIYARTESTFTATKTSFEAVSKTGGAAAVKFAKWRTSGQNAIGLLDSGTSKLYDCSLYGGQYTMLVPSSSVRGKVEMDNCLIGAQTFAAEDTLGVLQPYNNAFLYIDKLTKGSAGIVETKTAASAFAAGGPTVFSPAYATDKFTYVDCESATTTTADVRISRFYRGVDRTYDIGYIVMFRGASDTKKVRIKQGYYAPTATLVTTSTGADIELGANQTATFMYFTNTWVQVGGPDVDASLANEGIINVGAGAPNTSTLYTNSSGTGIVTLTAGDGLVSSETTGINGNITMALPYKSYVALISQSGTDAPTAIVLQNTLSGTITWVRNDVGLYLGTLTGAFTANKTTVIISNNRVAADGGLYQIADRASLDQIKIETYAGYTVPADDAMNKTYLEIRVYP